MWPMKLDLTRDECRGILRRLELESYANVVSAFRAQGALTQSKRGILDELRKIFHISQDRHKAEARRVANDEKLGTVAETISGPNTRQDWMREGRRLFPVLPRTPPYTAYAILANTVAEEITKQNDKLPHPMETRREMLPVDDPTIPPKPVVTEDPLIAFMQHQNHKKRDLKRSHFLDSDVEIKEEVDNTSSMDGFASPIKRRGQLYKHLQAPQKPMHHTNSKIQQLYQVTPAKPPTTKSKAKASSKKATKRQSHPKSPSKNTKNSQPSASKANSKNNSRNMHSYASPPNPSLFEPSTSYQILPSSKKDIEYNLTKMHPAALSPPITSTILHRSLTRKDDLNVVRNELDDISALNAVQQKITNLNDSHIPDPKIIFSTVPSSLENLPTSSILDQNPILKSTLTANAIKLSPNAVQVNTIPGRSNYKIIAPAPNSNLPIVTSKVIIKPPTTPIKCTNKISIQNLKLTPLNSVQTKNSPNTVISKNLQGSENAPFFLKNNILTLPTNSSLNPGQKVTIPKNIISNGAQSSNLNNIVVFDICPEQKIGKIITNNNILNNKTVITEDTPVDIIVDAPSLPVVTNNKLIKLNHNNNSNKMQTDWELELDQANLRKPLPHLQCSENTVQINLPCSENAPYNKDSKVKHQAMTEEEHFNAVIEEDNLVDDDDTEDMIIEETNDESNIIIYEDTKSNDDNFEQFIEENVEEEEEGLDGDDEDDAMTVNGEEIDVVGDGVITSKTNRMYNNVINAGHV